MSRRPERALATWPKPGRAGQSSAPESETDLPLLGSGRLLTAAEVGAVLSVAPRRVYALRDAGLIGYKIGRSLRFAPSDVLRFLEEGRDRAWPAS